MIQIFWVIDFIGLFLGRLILSIFLLLESKKSSIKFLRYLYLILSIFIFLGYYSSFAFIALIILEIIQALREKEKLENHLLKIALAIVFLFVGPGSLSLDRIFNIRF